MAVILPSIPTPVNINGELYSWVNIGFSFLGRRVSGIYEIEYGEEGTFEHGMAAGEYSIGYMRGQTKPQNGRIVLDLVEVEALQKVAPLGNLRLLPQFDITVSYSRNLGAQRITDIVTCLFTGNSRKLSSSEMGVKVDIPLFIAAIQFNAGQVPLP
jgi:hypothetical protein